MQGSRTGQQLNELEPWKPVQTMKSVNGKTTDGAQNQTAHVGVGGVSRAFCQVTQLSSSPYCGGP